MEYGTFTIDREKGKRKNQEIGKEKGKKKLGEGGERRYLHLQPRYHDYFVRASKSNAGIPGNMSTFLLGRLMNIVTYKYHMKVRGVYTNMAR